MAARLLHAHGLPGTQALADLFETPRNCNCNGSDGAPACGLAMLAELSDQTPTDPIAVGPVAAPLLLAVPFLTEPAQTWSVAWGEGSVTCGPEGVSLCGDLAPRVAQRVAIEPSAAPPMAKAPSIRSQPIPIEIWQRLEALAARTYVPESRTSRSAGAGPGISDSD